MNNKKDNERMSKEEIIETVVAIEEGKKQGLTPFQVGMLMGVRNIVRGKDKSGNKTKKK